MTQGKIQFSLGPLSFSGEGEQAWLSEQLDKVLEAAPKYSHEGQATTNGTEDLSAPSRNGNSNVTLASHIKDKSAETNQTKRFLVTADWLRLRGEKTLTTAMVSKALKDNHQKRLGNAADNLNQNIAKGFCEKTDGGFYITPDGLKSLGHAG